MDDRLQVRARSVNLIIGGRTEEQHTNLTPGETMAQAYRLARQYKKRGVSIWIQAFDSNQKTLLQLDGAIDLYRVDDYKEFVEGFLPPAPPPPTRSVRRRR